MNSSRFSGIYLPRNYLRSCRPINPFGKPSFPVTQIPSGNSVGKTSLVLDALLACQSLVGRVSFSAQLIVRFVPNLSLMQSHFSYLYDGDRSVEQKAFNALILRYVVGRAPHVLNRSEHICIASEYLIVIDIFF